FGKPGDGRRPAGDDTVSRSRQQHLVIADEGGEQAARARLLQTVQCNRALAAAGRSGEEEPRRADHDRRAMRICAGGGHLGAPVGSDRVKRAPRIAPVSGSTILSALSVPPWASAI